jgi:hypothetical protein
MLLGVALALDWVVHHFDDASIHATKGLRNIRNHLDAPFEMVVQLCRPEGQSPISWSRSSLSLWVSNAYP